ncbi:hypothetical protein [Mycobacterium paragordonae]|uniref:hypothetical protein n=1 Tax=Mycobacterium paragordonae TaxID=1389713 RepID=UPI00140DF7AC|nr:hypothetical protein [Mycobacterium paragordonae]
MEQELKTAISAFLWGRRLGRDAGAVAGDLVPFLMANYDITPKPTGFTSSYGEPNGDG